MSNSESWYKELFNLFGVFIMTARVIRLLRTINSLVYITTNNRRRGAVGSASDFWSVDTCQSWVRAPSKALVVSLSKKLYSYCLVLVGSRNGFERDLNKQKNACFTIELKSISINYKLTVACIIQHFCG